MQHVAASSGTAVWTTHPNQSNIATAEIGRPNNKLNYQLICKVFQMCCCRSVGYFLGALVEVLHSESVVNMRMLL